MLVSWTSATKGPKIPTRELSQGQHCPSALSGNLTKIVGLYCLQQTRAMVRVLCIFVVLLIVCAEGRKSRSKSKNSVVVPPPVAAENKPASVNHTTQTPLECMDRERNSSSEYVSILRYKSIGTMKPSFACYMVTQCSVDRLGRLGMQLRAWGGATSAAIYIPTTDHVQQMEGLRAIDAFLTTLREDAQYSGWLVVSLLFGHEASPQLWNCTRQDSPGAPTYPINALRNVAVAATSDDTNHVPPYLLYLDADFVPSAGLSEWIYNHAQVTGNGTFRDIMDTGGVVVVPAFESSGVPPVTRTRCLQYLLDSIRNRTVKQFHVGRYAPGHNATNYPRWMELSEKLVNISAADFATELYPTTHYERGYEPYIIMTRSTFVPYDERFRGYGYNKGINIRWLSMNGTLFYVLPGHFVVEDAHAETATFRSFMHKLDVRPYVNAKKDIEAHRLPLVSHNTAHLLRAAGFGKVATEDPTAHAAFLRQFVH